MMEEAKTFDPTGTILSQNDNDNPYASFNLEDTAKQTQD